MQLLVFDVFLSFLLVCNNLYKLGESSKRVWEGFYFPASKGRNHALGF